MHSIFNHILAFIILLVLTIMFNLVGFGIGVVLWIVNATMIGKAEDRKRQDDLIKAIKESR